METRLAAETIRSELKLTKDFLDNPIDLKLPVIPPFKGNGDIRLVILGQDPTIRNENSRRRISCTLNLDRRNALRTYIERICCELNISIENIYATNLFKYFYTLSPAKTMHVLRSHLQPNLDLLIQELSEYKNVPVISLGEPVLQLLTDDRTKVREFWDYDLTTKASGNHFRYSKASDNQLKTDLFPFPHQPSLRKIFYKDNLVDYIKFFKNNKQ